MSCEDLKELLSAYADGELPRAQMEFLEEHLAACLQCQQTLAEYQAVARKIMALGTVPAPHNLAEATVSRVKEGRTRRLLSRALAVILPVLAIMVVLLMLNPWAKLPSPETVMARAYAATKDLRSYRMSSSIRVMFGGTVFEQSSEWSFAYPDRYRGKVILDGKVYEFILVGGQQYVREPEQGLGRLYLISPLGLVLTREDTLEILDSLGDLERLPDEEVQGTTCLHYRGNLPGASSQTIEVELWIGKSDYLVRQIRRQILSGSEVVATSTGRCYAFNTPIKIEPPVTELGELLPGWRLINNSAR